MSTELATLIVRYTGASESDAAVMASLVIRNLDDNLCSADDVVIDHAVVESLESVDSVPLAVRCLRRLTYALYELTDAMTDECVERAGLPLDDDDG
jgi:hypothetical protein